MARQIAPLFKRPFATQSVKKLRRMSRTARRYDRGLYQEAYDMAIEHQEARRQDPRDEY